MPSFAVRVFRQGLELFCQNFSGPLDVGRRDREKNDPAPIALVSGTQSDRLVVAEENHREISRLHLTILPIDDRTVSIYNRHTKKTLERGEGNSALLPPLKQSNLALPISLKLGDLTLSLRVVAPEDDGLAALEEPIKDLDDRSYALTSLGQVQQLHLDEDQERVLFHWLDHITQVLQSAAHAADVFEQVARAVVKLVGMDLAGVLLWKDGKRSIEACFAPRAQAATDPWSERVIEQARANRRTFWYTNRTKEAENPTPSLIGVACAVAVPLIGRQGEVLGVVYAHQCQANTMEDERARKLAARLVEILARGAAAGLARLELERAQFLYEQFFTPPVVRALLNQPDLLRGQEREISMLFCDIRGYSRITEKLGPERTSAWITDVLEEFSDGVFAEEGVLLDYRGDELIAMWGAPADQPDHARRACRAALTMLDRLERLNDKWRSHIEADFNLGIGICSGPAMVGNTGSQRMVKYGANGNTVNMASRIQGATKYFRTRLLIAGSTRDQLSSQEFGIRRVCNVRVLNIATPVELYEIVPAKQDLWSNLQQTYERALREFEQQRFKEAAQQLGMVFTLAPLDGPSLALLSRIADIQMNPSAPFDAVWELPGK